MNDAENHIKTVDGAVAYVYDGEGQRVRKLLGENVRMVYGITGGLIAEFDGTSGDLKKEYIYGADGLAATIAAGEGTRYVTADHLGSPRILNATNGAVISRHDYQLFGEELFAGMGNRTISQGYSNPTDSLRQKFATYERDIETGLDFAQARYYGSTAGRFSSPDPYNIILEAQATAEINPAKAQAQFLNYLSHPQQWNRYVYVVNNPLKYVDPTGEELWLTGTGEERKQALERIEQLVGKDASKYLTTREICTEQGMVTVVGYSSNAFAKSEPGITTRLANIIDSNDVVEFRIAKEFNTKDGHFTAAYFGGAATVGREESLTGNTQIFVHPDSATIAQDVLGVPTVLAGSRSNDGKPLDFYNDIVDAHEFGHAYANIFDRVKVNSDQSDKRARDLENIVRARRGLPNRRVKE